ncbi:unnamed protein product, partial [Brenthis ino]
MTTRRAFARQEESKLQLALQELKVSKDLCAQLHSEREENEKELLTILKSNDKLKASLTRLHIDYSDLSEERDRLKSIVVSFDECAVEYEQALKRITTLECELRDAQKYISELEVSAHQATALHTHSLFEELVENAPELVDVTIENPVTIDLTNDTLPAQRLDNCSNNKLKKYIKVNKLIKKTKKILSKNKCISKIYKNNSSLLSKFNVCKLELENISQRYESDTQLLELHIAQLQTSLRSITAKYESSEKMLNEYQLEMDELLKLSKYNSERFDSLTNNCICECKQLSSPPPVNTPPFQGILCDRTDLSTVDSSLQHGNTYMYSDEIGRNMGTYLYSQFDTKVSNSCLPNCCLSEIISQIHKDSKNFNIQMYQLSGIHNTSFVAYHGITRRTIYP